MFGWFSKDRYKVEDFSSRSSYSSGWTTTTIFGEKPINRRERAAIVGDAKELHKAMTEEEAVTAEEREALKAIHTFQKKIKVENCYPRSIDPRFQKNIEEATMQTSRYPRKEELAEMIEKGRADLEKQMKEAVTILRPRVARLIEIAARQGKHSVTLALHNIYSGTENIEEERNFFHGLNDLIRGYEESYSLYSSTYIFSSFHYTAKGEEINHLTLNRLLLDAIKEDLKKDNFTSYITTVKYSHNVDLAITNNTSYYVLKVNLI